MAGNRQISDHEPDQSNATASADQRLRDQFPVIVDFDRRIDKLEKRYHRLRDLAILSIAVGLGIAFGSLVENYSNGIDWGWPAGITCGVTIVGMTAILRWAIK